MKIFIFKKIVIIISVFLLLGCQGEKKEILYPPPIPEVKKLPIDYVFLIDNSGSIPRGEAQEFTREAIKAFIELAEINDKISIITFDETARIIGSEVISGTNSRISLKNALNSGLNFRGHYTDIGSGINLLRRNRQRFFRGREHSTPIVILISDGRLQPRMNLAKTYQLLLEDFAHLAQISRFYTIGLGNREIHTEFLPNISGHSLLNTLADKSDGEFFAVQNINDLMDACITLLRISKGYGELSGKEVFLTDESTSRLMLLIVKRLPSQQLYETRHINILDVKDRRINLANYRSYETNDSRINWKQGHYYDLVIIERPNPGRWTVTIANDIPPKVIAFIKHQIHLRYQVKSEYYEQEEKVIMAWLYDERSQAISNKPYTVKARLDSIENLPLTKNIVSLQQNENLTFLSLMTLNQLNLPLGQFQMQLEATDTSDYFIRKSPILPIRVKEAYFKFIPPERTVHKWPIFWKGLTFSAIIDTTHRACPDFASPPEITVFIGKLEDDEITHLDPIKMDWQFKDTRLLYQGHLNDLEKGNYLLQFRLSGTLKTGQEAQRRSLDFYYRLIWPIWVWIILALLLAVMLYILAFLFRPRLKRRLELIQPTGKPIRLSGHKLIQKSIKGEYLKFGGRGNEMSQLISNSFVLIAKRKRRIFIRVISGNITLTRNDQSRPIQKTTELFRNDRLSFSDNNVNYKIRVICPRTKH